MLQPEPVGLQGQSALSFMLFIYTMQRSNSPILIAPRGLAILWPPEQSSTFQARNPARLGMVGGGVMGEVEGGRRNKRLQQWASTDRVPY